MAATARLFLVRLVAHQQLPRAYCSVDESIRAALSRVAERVREVDPAAIVHPSVSDDSIRGVRTPGPKMILRFTCTHGPCVAVHTEEDRTTTRIISKRSYEQGASTEACSCARPPSFSIRQTLFFKRGDISRLHMTERHSHFHVNARAGLVIVRCQACDRQHLIADNFGWFGNRVNIEQILAERGEEVRRILDESPETLNIDPQKISPSRS